jgi:hypothetical protein
MNRHERRKAAAQQRGGKVREVFVPLGDPSDPVRKALMAQTIDNADFRALVPPMVNAYVEWRKAHPEAMPRWKPQRKEIVMGPLDAADARETLADNDDAHDALEHLSECFPGVNILQAEWAVRYTEEHVRQTLAERTTYASPGFKLFEDYALGNGVKTRMPECACPHCGTEIGAASAGNGKVPTPGHLVVCVVCGGIGCFGDDMRPRLMTEAEWADLPPKTRTQLEEAGALFKASAMRAASGGSKGRVDA